MTPNNPQHYWGDDSELNNLIEERTRSRNRRMSEKNELQREIDNKVRELDQREILLRSRTPTEDIITKYPTFVKRELVQHEEKMEKNPNMSPMWEIPLPNESRKYPETPYELKSVPNEFSRRYVNRGGKTKTTRKGGVKKRMTRKGKNKKKKKKQRRRTNKKKI